jgi:hypothetical protein
MQVPESGKPRSPGGGDPTGGGRAIPRIEPDYADPIYLDKHGAFIAVLKQIWTRIRLRSPAVWIRWRIRNGFTLTPPFGCGMFMSAIRRKTPGRSTGHFEGVQFSACTIPQIS